MIGISETAANHIKTISDNNGNKIPFLSVKGGGCAGFSYDWQLKEETELDIYSDEIVNLDNGGKLAIDGYSLMYLFGSTIDLKSDMFGTTLEIVNPAAASSCGCGESINFDMDQVEANMNITANNDFKIPE
jgi:iron-sulfur cluster assembly accessory protein